MATEWNWAHLHLLINHLPMVGIPLVLLFATYAVYEKDERLLRMSAVFTLMLGMGSIPVAVSGYLAQDIAHELPWVSETYMHKHETVALGSLAGLLVFGGWVVFLQRKKAHVSRRFTMILTSGMICLSASFGWVAYLGGKIVHAEIRPGELLPQPMHQHDHAQNEIAPKTPTRPAFAVPMTSAQDALHHEHSHRHAD